MKKEKEGLLFDLDSLVSKIGHGDYWADFLKVRRMEAGVLRLHPGEEDTQEPHDDDELYFVAEGSGFIEMGGKKKPVKAGSIIFVPARMVHRFCGNKDALVAIYVFAG